MEKTASPSEPPLSLLAGGFSELSLYLCVILGRIWWGNGEMLQKIWSWAKFLPYVVSGFLQPKKIKEIFRSRAGIFYVVFIRRIRVIRYIFGWLELKLSLPFHPNTLSLLLSPNLSCSNTEWTVRMCERTTPSALEKIFEDKGLFSLSSLHE